MRLKDKSRKERVQRLALGMLASSIFQWKLSLGQESVLTPAPAAALPPRLGITAPMCCIQKKTFSQASGTIAWLLGAVYAIHRMDRRRAAALCRHSAADRYLLGSPAMIHRHWLILSGTSRTQQ